MSQGRAWIIAALFASLAVMVWLWVIMDGLVIRGLINFQF
jgi:hypothetical protein